MCAKLFRKRRDLLPVQHLQQKIHQFVAKIANILLNQLEILEKREINS